MCTTRVDPLQYNTCRPFASKGFQGRFESPSGVVWQLTPQGREQATRGDAGRDISALSAHHHHLPGPRPDSRRGHILGCYVTKLAPHKASKSFALTPHGREQATCGDAGHDIPARGAHHHHLPGPRALLPHGHYDIPGLCRVADHVLPPTPEPCVVYLHLNRVLFTYT